MFLFIIKNIIISVFLIILVHFSYNYLKRTFTTPKIKDLVVKPRKQYNKIYEFIEQNKTNEVVNDVNDVTNVNDANMENELKKYIEEINTNNTGNPDTDNSFTLGDI